MSKSTNAAARAYGAILDGIARGLDLAGHPLDIKGTTIEGQPFDLGRLRGNVVLVVFRDMSDGDERRLLAVRQKFERYNKAGFDVVSVILEERRDAVATYAKRKPAPWAVLCDGPLRRNPYAICYGVRRTPWLILVDRDGKVVSAGPQSDEWSEKLAELLEPDEQSCASKFGVRRETLATRELAATVGVRRPARRAAGCADERQSCASKDRSKPHIGPAPA